MNFVRSKQTKRLTLFVLIVALLGGVFYGGWRYWRSGREEVRLQEAFLGRVKLTPTPTPTPITKPTDDPNWNLYINKEYGFSVEYPRGWEVKESSTNTEGDNRYRMRSWVKFVKAGSASIMISIWEVPRKDLLEWAKENKSLIVSGGATIPDGTNAKINGVPTLVVYSPPGQAPSSIVALLKHKNLIFKISHFTPKNENPLLWDIYEHFLRTFEFEDTKDIPDELPEFPMGF